MFLCDSVHLFFSFCPLRITAAQPNLFFILVAGRLFFSGYNYPLKYIGENTYEHNHTHIFLCGCCLDVCAGNLYILSVWLNLIIIGV